MKSEFKASHDARGENEVHYLILASWLIVREQPESVAGRSLNQLQPHKPTRTTPGFACLFLVFFVNDLFVC